MARIPDKWLDPALELTLRVWAIDPHSLDVVRCEVGEVLPNGCSFTEGYYADTRSSATLQLMNPDIPDGSWLRVIVEDSDGGSEEIGTFVSNALRTSWFGVDKIVDIDLQSPIWTLSEDRTGSHWTIGANTNAKTAIEAVCNACGRARAYLPGFNDYTSGNAVSYEIEDSLSSVLFDICGRSKNRMDVDGHGRLTFGPYVSPANRGVTWEVDMRDERSIVLADNIGEEDNSHEAYGRSVVVWKGRLNENDQEDTEIVSQANVSPSHAASADRRGYTRTNVHVETDLSPATSDRASQLAKQYLVDDSASAKSGSMTVMWCPIHEGDIIGLTRSDGSYGRWLVQTVESSASSWTKSLTLKEC